MNIKNLLERKYLLYLSLFFTCAILVGSLISMNNIVIIPAKNSDKYIHSLAYFVLSVSWFLTFREKAKKNSVKILIISLILLFGIIIEVLQGVLTKYRQADFFDIIANSVGIILASILFYFVFIKKKRK